MTKIDDPHNAATAMGANQSGAIKRLLVVIEGVCSDLRRCWAFD